MLKSGFLRLGALTVKRVIRLLLTAFFLAYSAIAPAEANIVVVAHKDSPLIAMSREEVVDLFLGKYKTSHDIPVRPLDSKDSSLRDRFYSATANMSGMRVKAYWSPDCVLGTRPATTRNPVNRG